MLNQAGGCWRESAIPQAGYIANQDHDGVPPLRPDGVANTTTGSTGAKQEQIAPAHLDLALTNLQRPARGCQM